MSDFRTRLGEQLGAAAGALADGSARIDFRARLGAQLTEAIVELQRERAAALGPAGAQVLSRPAADGAVLPPGDLRERFGAVLTAAAARLARERAPLPLPAAGRRARASAARRTTLDFRDRLGASLTASAATLAGVRARGIAIPAARATPPRRRRGLVPHLARPVAIGVAAMGLAGAATASSVWLVSVGNPNGGVNPGLSATAPPEAQLELLGVLRQRQSSTDRGPGVQIALQDINEFTTGVRSSYVRVLETTAGGPVVLVPVAERDPTPAGGGGSHAPIADALCIYYPVAAGAGPLGSHPGCWSTTQLLDGTAVSASGGRVFGLAPDGVTSVTIAAAGAPAISAPVAGNFFDALLPAPAPTSGIGGTPPPSKLPAVTFNRG